MNLLDEGTIDVLGSIANSRDIAGTSSDDTNINTPTSSTNDSTLQPCWREEVRGSDVYVCGGCIDECHCGLLDLRLVIVKVGVKDL